MNISLFKHQRLNEPLVFLNFIIHYSDQVDFLLLQIHKEVNEKINVLKPQFKNIYTFNPVQKCGGVDSTGNGSKYSLQNVLKDALWNFLFWEKK